MKETIKLGCVSQDSPQRKCILREDEKLGSNRTVKFSKTTMRYTKFLERRVHRRESCKSVNLRSEFRGLQNLRKERKTKPWNKSDAPAEKRGTWRIMSLGSKRRKKDTFYSPAEAWVMPTHPSKKQKARSSRIRGRLWSVCAHAGQQRTGNSSKIQEPHNGGHGQWRSANEQGSTSLCSRS